MKRQLGALLLTALLWVSPALASGNDLMQVNDPTVTLAATTSTSNVALGSTSNFLTVINAGPDLAYVRCGGSTITATTATTLIPPGAVMSYRKAPTFTYCAGISAGTSALSFQSGSGE